MVRLFVALSSRYLPAVAALAPLGIALIASCASPQPFVVPDEEVGGAPQTFAGAPSTTAGATSESGSGNVAGADTAGAFSSSGAPGSSGSTNGFSGASSAGSPGAAGAPNGGSGSAGSGAGGSVAAGAPGSAGSGSAGAPGSAGSTGGNGCAAQTWASGKTYKAGDMFTAVCSVIGGGAAVCMKDKKYSWTCTGATCSVYAPGADGWWANYTIGGLCN